MTSFIHNNGDIQVKAADLSFDLTPNFYSLDASYSSWDLSSGLCVVSGSLVVRQSETYKVFDDRFTNEYSRGTEIDITKNNNPIPIAGKSFIVSTAYDFGSTMSIEITCRLGAVNYVTNEDLAVCFNFGEKTKVNSIITQLLLAAGVPEQNLNSDSYRSLDRFYIEEPFSLDQGASLVQTAGSLLGQYGFLLYCRNDGTVTSKNILTFSNYNHSLNASDLFIYSRQGTNESLVRQLTGELDIVKTISPLDTDQDSVRSGNIILNAIREVDVVNLETVSTIEDYRLDVLGNPILYQTEVTTKKYEKGTAVLREGAITTTSDCYPEENTRIVSDIKEKTSNNTELIKAWLSYKATATVPTGFSISGTFVSQKTVTDYYYSGAYVSIVKSTYQARAIILPIYGDLSLGRGSGSIPDQDPEDLILAEVEVSQYKATSLNSQKYTLVVNKYLNKFVNSNEVLTAQAVNTAISLANIALDLEDMVLVSSDISFNQQLPNIESFSKNLETYDTRQSFQVGSPVETIPYTVKESIFLGRYGNIETQLIYDILSEALTIRNGRVYGMQIAFPLRILPYNEYESFAPLSLTKAEEPIQTDTSSIYRMDSPSISISQDRAILSYNGLFRGFVVGYANSNYTLDASKIQTPSSFPNADRTFVIEFNEDDNNYYMEVLSEYSII